MSMNEWAKREVEIACKRERGDDETPNMSDYGCACYESALKAFESLCEDGHSGMSIGLTKAILDRMIDGKPLTPIDDTEEIWNILSTSEGCKTYQCKRMSSFFKYVYPCGKVEYKDIDRIIMYSGYDYTGSYHAGFISRFVEKHIPSIKMPYMPSSRPYKVRTKDFLAYPDGGDFDTVKIIDVLTPEGKLIPLNIHIAEKDDKMVEITAEEYAERWEAAKKLAEERRVNDDK